MVPLLEQLFNILKHPVWILRFSEASDVFVKAATSTTQCPPWWHFSCRSPITSIRCKDGRSNRSPRYFMAKLPWNMLFSYDDIVHYDWGKRAYLHLSFVFFHLSPSTNCIPCSRGYHSNIDFHLMKTQNVRNMQNWWFLCRHHRRATGTETTNSRFFAHGWLAGWIWR